MSAPTSGADFTLHFTEWQCGHHCQRPEDIPVHSPEQALQVLHAISCAISQPGHARAAILQASLAAGIYLTDDYVDPAPIAWRLRPQVVHGTAEELDQLMSAELKEERDWILPEDLSRWDERRYVWADESVLTTLTPAQVLALITDGADSYPEQRLFEFPPIFRPAADIVAELLQTDTAISKATLIAPSMECAARGEDECMGYGACSEAGSCVRSKATGSAV
ncbi:MAG: hypothetical protein V4739_11775 [Pseudomonadota bacterium]